MLDGVHFVCISLIVATQTGCVRMLYQKQNKVDYCRVQHLIGLVVYTHFQHLHAQIYHGHTCASTRVDVRHDRSSRRRGER